MTTYQLIFTKTHHGEDCVHVTACTPCGAPYVIGTIMEPYGKAPVLLMEPFVQVTRPDGSTFQAQASIGLEGMRFIVKRLDEARKERGLV